MSRIKTKELVEKLEEGNYEKLILRKMPDRTYCMMVEDSSGMQIHENLEGRIKIYQKSANALTWLKSIGITEKIYIDSELTFL